MDTEETEKAIVFFHSFVQLSFLRSFAQPVRFTVCAMDIVSKIVQASKNLVPESAPLAASALKDTDETKTMVANAYKIVQLSAKQTNRDSATLDALNSLVNAEHVLAVELQLDQIVKKRVNVIKVLSNKTVNVLLLINAQKHQIARETRDTQAALTLAELAVFS